MTVKNNNEFTGEITKNFGDSKRYHQTLDLVDIFKEAGAEPLFSFRCK